MIPFRKYIEEAFSRPSAGGDFPTYKQAEFYAVEKAKKLTDSLDTIEIWQTKDGHFNVVAGMNSQKRDSVKKAGGKKVAAVSRKGVKKFK